MHRRNLAFAVLAGAGLLVVVGVGALIVGFATSALGLIYLSVACSVLASAALAAGLGLLLGSRVR